MSIFIISSFLTVFTSLLLGFAIFLKNPKSKEAQLWLMVSFSVALWSVGLGMELSSTSYDKALFWNKLLNLGAIFIPIFYYHFIVNFLEKNRQERFIIWSGYLFSIILAYILFFMTDLFMNGVPPKAGFEYWIDPAPVYYLFLLFFVLYVLRSAYLLIRFKNESSIIKKRQINFLIASIVIGFGGGITNFLPQIINIYPFGNYFVMLYVIIIAYAILKHHLFDIKIIATELFVFAITITLLIRALLAQDPMDRIIGLIIFLAVSVFSFLLVRSVLQEVKVREEKEKLVKDLEIANDKLQELDKLKSEFLSMATHQIRAPLTAISGYASELIEGDFGEISPKVRGAINTIFISCKNLVVIVSEFLDISRIEQGRMKYELTDFDVTALIQEILTELRPTIEKLPIKFNLKNSQYVNIVHGDIGKIKQIIGNLIDNSLKYTKQGEVNISITSDDKKVNISIADTGIGISEEDIPKLFAKFTRAKEAFSTNVIGTGLGLYVARQMIEAQNGKIWVESPGRGKGSTFFVQLPRK